MALLGVPLPRLEGREKVTGAARYAYEEYGEGDTLYAWVVQASIVKGRILRMDTAAVLAMPGVAEVVTYENAPELHDAKVPELLVLQSPEVRYRGEPIAIVVAGTLEQAREGAGQLRVEYAEEPWDVRLDPDSPKVFRPEGVNGGLAADTSAGDVDAAMRVAAVTVDATYTTPAQVNHPLEPHAITAWFEPTIDGGTRLELIEATQGPTLASQTVATLFGLETAAVRLRCEHVGGGFGAKGSPKPDLPLATMAALVTGQRVKLAYTRQMMPSIGGYRSPTVSRVRLAADRDGTLVAVAHDALAQTGTFGIFAEQTADGTRHAYAAPNRLTTHRLEPLDVPIPRFMRAPGEAPGSFALESAMDELAIELDLDPVALRLANEPATDPGDGSAFSTRNLVWCLRRGAERFGWRPRGASPTLGRRGRFLTGTGVAASYYPARVQSSGATVTALDDGSFVVGVAASDIGTGARTVLMQVAADALGVPAERVRMRIADSTLPPAPPGVGSFGTMSWSFAVHKACTHLRERLAAGAQVPPAGLRVTTTTEEEVSSMDERSRHAYGAQFVEVRVDPDSGEVTVDRMLGAFAAGHILNPRLARSQFLGGMTWGIGMALTEVAHWDPVGGDVGNRDFATYHVAASADVRRLDVEWLDEAGEDLTPIGGKGLGELGIVGAAAAIANAVRDATGVRIRDLPIQPDSLVPAMPLA